MGHIGITGTRWGMSERQKEIVLYIYRKAMIIFHNAITLHQGMCEGSDTEMHDLIREYDSQATVIGHPSIKKDHEVWRQCDKYREDKDHLERNRDIVAEVDLMVATPHQEEEQQRGGTWYTIRHAKKVIKSGEGNCKKLYVVFPSGKVEFYDFAKLQNE
jgi:hypothetical protein